MILQPIKASTTVAKTQPATVSAMPRPTVRLSCSTSPSAMTMLPKAGGPLVPGPGTNGPPAFGNIVMALGLIEHDSKTTGWGVGLTIAGCVFATVVLVLLVWLGVEALHWFF